MLELLDQPTASEAIDEAIRADVARACRRIPPLWDLENYVAVNPFLGYAASPIAAAAAEVADGLGASVLPDVAYYRERWREGAFAAADLRRASAAAGRDAEELAAVLDGRVEPSRRPAGTVRTFAERLGGPWHGVVIRQAARWCAVHASGGGTYWRRTDKAGLYPSWREAARVDRSPEIAGLRGWRRWIDRLPDRADEAIAAMLARREVPDDEREAYLYRLLGGLYGWASFLRRSSWERGNDGPGALVDLLAIRICGDAAVAELAPRGSERAVAPTPDDVEDEAVRLVFQEALEDGYLRGISRRLAPPPDRPAMSRPAVQAVFCIDVRSEPFRRHLEARDPSIKTLGFAGFFGVAIAWQGDGTARCPVLLKPSVMLGPADGRAPGKFAGALRSLLAAPASAFTAVELLGLAYGIGLAADALAVRPAWGAGPTDDAVPFRLDPDGQGGGLSSRDRADLAAGILENLGLRGPVARLVLLCGHEGRSANNPHAAGLHCGACGGHGGALNARIAAAVLNDPSVRAELARRGRALPDDTHFVAAVHETTVDRIRLLDADRVPPGHRDDLDRLRRWLEVAGDRVRSERAPALGLGQGGREAGLLERILDRRARDASEVRPEWGLARNAAFIAARRERTRGVDLEGRAFLHEYDEATDPDGSILTLILSAPMVVGSWINLQYLASTVDNRAFGCGTKALHNRVGSLGVVLGNGGDLRTGLAIQSVHAPDGRWFHEPIRLQVLVEAARDRIARVLATRPDVRDLVDNGWVRLFAIDPDGDGLARWVPGRGWADEPVV